MKFYQTKIFVILKVIAEFIFTLVSFIRSQGTSENIPKIILFSISVSVFLYLMFEISRFRKPAIEIREDSIDVNISFSSVSFTTHNVPFNKIEYYEFKPGGYWHSFIFVRFKKPNGKTEDLVIRKFQIKKFDELVARLSDVLC